MSAIAAVLSMNGGPPDERLVRGLLAHTRARAGGAIECVGEGAVALGVGRNDWELGAGFSEGILLARDGRLMVAADASLYHREDLQRSLAAAGVRLVGTSPAELILAAYRAWGSGCADRLEGDFAFIVWDGRRGELFCARDFAGRRPLFYARAPGELVIASTPDALLSYPGVSDELNLPSVADAAAGLAANCHETTYRAVCRLPAGYWLRAHPSELRVERHWQPHPGESARTAPFEEAALELRALLQRSIAERLWPEGPTAIQLSGGWDSSAIFGAGKSLIRERGLANDLRPVSISYPPGDPGREDELIQAIADHWSTAVHWLEIDDIPLLDGAQNRAGARAEPLSHPYEAWNRALVAGGRAVGARVMFDGFGGDSLFQCSPIFFADLLRAGNLRELRQEWRAKGMSGARSFFRWAVRPLLPPSLEGVAVQLRRGRPLPRHLERSIPPWLQGPVARELDLQAREREALPAYRGTQTDAELYWYLTYPFIPEMLSANFGFGMEGGLELRSPLYDRRIIEFACARPRAERSSGRETKRLLRQAGKGLLPDHVLAPRPARTGVTTGYLLRSLRADGPPLLEEFLRSPVLAQFGLVEPRIYRNAFLDYLAGRAPQWGAALYFTLQTEFWLRQRVRERTTRRSSAAAGVYEHGRHVAPARPA